MTSTEVDAPGASLFLERLQSTLASNIDEGIIFLYRCRSVASRPLKLDGLLKMNGKHEITILKTPGVQEFSH